MLRSNTYRINAAPFKSRDQFTINNMMASYMMASSSLSISISKLLLLCALISGVGADDNDVLQLSNNRLRSHDEGDPQRVVTKDDHGHLVEVVVVVEESSEPQHHFKQTRIVGGEAPDEEDAAYPFFVQLQRADGSLFCGGQLISPDIVLTAAHCVDNVDPISLPAQLSIWNGNRMEERIPESGVIHPSYESYANDLALIKLTQPALAVNEVSEGGATYWELVDDYEWIDHPPILRLQRYQTPSGCTSLYYQGLAPDILTFTVIGHGTTSSGGAASGELLEADVHYVLNSVCNAQYGPGSVTDDMLCAADTTEEQDACQGDSGGPLFTRLPTGDGEHNLFTLVGVVSWGYGCADKEYPGVYSRVAMNTDWIDVEVCENLSPKSCTADGKIRDYALDSLTANSRRRTQNVSTNNGRTLADLVKGVDYFGPETQKEELCELLGGDVDEEVPSFSPSSTPSELPTLQPSSTPSELPTLQPSSSGLPTLTSSSTPSELPTLSPSYSSAPSELPTLPPSSTPSELPTLQPSSTPSELPTLLPSSAPSELPTLTPSSAPSELPTLTPSSAPSELPSNLPSLSPSSPKPSSSSTGSPTITSSPSHAPIIAPTVVPSVPPSLMPSTFPSGSPSVVPSVSPSGSPSHAPNTSPSVVPSLSPSSRPSKAPITSPSVVPSLSPSSSPSHAPIISPSAVPSVSPSSRPSKAPITSPSVVPSLSPSRSPSHAPVISPSVVPSVSPTLTPSSSSTGSPTLPRGKSPTKTFTTKYRDGNKKAKGIVFQLQAEDGDVYLERLAFKTKDNRATNVKAYFKLGSYQTFSRSGRDRNGWGAPVFNGVPYRVPGGFRAAAFSEPIVIPKGEIASFYLEGKKEIMFVPGQREFAVADGSGDFKIFTGSGDKKAFNKRMMNADFVGEFTYYTYREATRVTSTPSLQPSLSPSELPTLPPSMLPSNLPSLPPSSPEPSTSISPSHAPVISPSMVPSVSPSLTPSSSSTGSPTLPPRTSPTSRGINDGSNADRKAKGLMFQVQAKDGDVNIEKLTFKTKDNRATNVKAYFKLGSYQTFSRRGRSRDDWGAPVSNGVPYRVPGGYREVTFSEPLVIPKGQTASIYLEGKKEIMCVRGRWEFAVAEDTKDFMVFTGSADRKPFNKKMMNADFVGGFTYYTYREHSSSEPPTSEDGGSGGDRTLKEYTTPDVNKAKDDAEGVMFSITAKSKEVSISGLGILGEDDKKSDLGIYYQDDLYKDFNALDENKWIEVFSDEVKLDPDKLVDIELTHDITIPAGGTVSVYIVSKKEVVYKKSRVKEFDVDVESDDFALRVGRSTKKEFRQFDRLAEFVGRIIYQI